jgi:hypothetical protein
MRRKKALVLVFLFLLVVPNIFITASTHRSRGGDFRGFLIAGERFLQGTFLYEGSTVASNVTWPPFFAVFIVPFTLSARVNLPLTQVLWYILNGTLFFISIGIWCRILYAKPCGWLDDKKELSLYTPAFILPLVCVSGPLLDNAVALQLSTFLFFLLTMGVDSLQGKKSTQAGLWFGLAAALKAFPVIIIVYLIYRKEFRATIAMLITGTLLTAIPIVRYGLDGFIHQMQAWISISLSGGYPLGGLNQSVYSMVARYIAANPFELMFRRLPAPPPDSPEAIAATWVFRLLFAVCIGMLWWLLFRKRYRNIGLETAYFITLMTMFSPISWRHYYVLMMPAWMVLTQWWIERRDVVLKWIVTGSGILISGFFLVGQISKPVRGFLLCVMSNFTLGAFVILAGLLYCIVKGYGNKNAREHPAIGSPGK